jgi:hypothetical protein
MKIKRMQRPERATERAYTPEQLQELIATAEQAANPGTQRMLEREKAYQSMKKSGQNEHQRR